MVVPIPNTPNTNQPKQNVDINVSPNLVKPTIENPMINPNFRKDIKIHGPDHTYNIDVHYSTDLTHPELAPKHPMENPIKEKMKTLSPVQEITVIGRGTDPNVIINNPTKINPYVREKEQTAETLVKTQTTNANNSESVLGPFTKAFNSSDVNQILQITGGLTLPELFQILGININSFVPHNRGNTINGPDSWSYVGSQANVSFSGNNITFYRQYVNENSSGRWYNYYTNNQQIEIKPYYYTYKGKTYKLVEVIFKNNIQINNTYNYSDNTYNHYYIIDPKTKQILYSGSSEHPIVNMSKLNSIETGDLIQPGKEIENVLKQYGYQLSQQELQEINNLQKGQSIKLNASAGTAGAVFEITYLGNDQYRIKSLSEFYNFKDFNNPWTSINETISIPTYNINTVGGEIMTTGLNINGTIKTYGTTNINQPYYITTYNVNESIPINYEYNTQTGQLTFWGSNPQGGINLQNINLPTLTYQQYIQLANGQIPPGIKPGWYYYPTLNEFVQVSYQTVQKPQINWNALWYGYSSMYQNGQNLPQNTQIYLNPLGYSSTNPNNVAYIGVDSNTNTIYLLNSYGQVIKTQSFNNNQSMLEYLNNNFNLSSTSNITTNTSTNQPQILQESFFSPQIISDIWTSITTLGSDIYHGITSLFSPQKPKSSNITTSNYSNNYSQVSTTLPPNVNGVLAPSIQLSGKEKYQAELQNIIYESQEIEQEVNNNQAYGGPTWLGTDVYGLLAQGLAGMGLKQPAEFFLNLEKQSLTAGTPANILANIAGLGEILGSIAMVEYSVPEEIGGSIGTNALNAIRTQLTPMNFAKNYALTTIPNLIFSNAINYRLTGQPLSSYQDIESAIESIPFTFVYSGISGYYESISNNILGKIIGPEETNLYKIIGSKVLYDTGANYVAGTTSNLAMQGFNNLVGWQNGINWNEALFSGIFSEGVTLGIEGIQGIRAITSGGEGIWSITSGSPYRYKTSNVDVTFPYGEEDLLKAKVYAGGETTYLPHIGKLTLTPDILSNVETKIAPFETEGELNLVKGGSIQNENGWILTGYGYNGEFITRSGNSEVTANVQGNIPLIIIPKEYPIEPYTQDISNLLNRLESEHPEFKEISYIPQEGLAGFRSLLEGNTYNLFNNYNTYLYNRLLENPIEIAGEFGFTPNEYLNAMQYAEQTYNEISTNLPNNVKSLNLPNQESLNIRVPFSYFQAENTNFNEGTFGRVVIGNEGIAKTSLGETYITQSESFGPIYFTSGENSQLSSLLTTYGIMKNPKTDINWVYLHQSGSVSLPGNVQLSWGIGEAIDPSRVQELLEEFNEIGKGRPIQNLPLTQEQLRNLLGEAIKSNAEQFTYPPPLYRPINVYGFPINTFNMNYGTNQNIIRQNNNYNIGMNRVPNIVQNVNQIAQQLSYNVERPILNEYNIQNELSTMRENLRRQIRTPNQIQPIININPLQNYGKEMYYGVQNIQSMGNKANSQIRPRGLGKGSELLRPRQKTRSLEKEEERETLIMPEIGLAAGVIYRQETDKSLITTTTTTTRIKPKPTTKPTPYPPYPPNGFPPFGFPEITIMGQPIRGLVPGFGRGVRSMYDIQYALSRLQW